ncbi:uncharacterized protein LOC100167148 isoform X2 [Acyrthosiphon pisum]|nr:uncharacterized protein LOC100167148 isoform X2 [Acyrthosiphon pisum]
MTTGCGRPVDKNSVLIDDDKKGLIKEVPWSVGIYYYTRISTYPLAGYQFCEGSIIAPNVVISVAQCFSNETGFLSHKISVKKGRFRIAIGKYDRSTTIVNNNQLLTEKIIDNDNQLMTQIIKVDTIYVNEVYNGEDGFYGENIAVIVLENKISFSNDVAPVCIDWIGKYKVHNGDIGKISVWRKEENETQNPVLLERFLPFIEPSKCRKKISTKNQQLVYFDKFCTTYTLEQGAGYDNTGAGISFLHSNSYFLTGVLTFMDDPKDGIFSGFTDLKYYVQWIRGILNKHFIENSCVLPIVEGVLYSYEGSNEILSHGTLINHHRTIIEKCELGYHMAYPIGIRFCQGKGKWLSNTEKLCFKMCPPLISDSLDIKCSHNGKYANCSNLSIPDTIATASCKPTFTAPNEQEITLELLCQSNGLWNKQLYRCHPYCGRVYVKNHALIDNGDKALVGTAPWNVGIYQLNKTDYNYDMICGGSIISQNLIISAAHCFWKKGMLSKNISITDGLYKIGVGKYNRNFTIIDNEFAQIINVEMIHLKEGYYGSTGFHAEDIAIIVLQNEVSFSNGVSPVCIDWNSKYNEVNGDQGKIVGWGKTEKGISSPILLEASLPYIDHSTCRNMFTNGFELFVTVDKFCAGSTLVSGQGLDQGDSGSGLCFFHSGSYYLTGLVSIKDPSTNNSIAVFTEVKYHIRWIRELFNNFK